MSTENLGETFLKFDLKGPSDQSFFQPQDLRIGNIVKFDKYEAEVKGISQKGVGYSLLCNGYNLFSPYYYLKPVVLDLEWVQRLSVNHADVIFDECKRERILYVHEFQNKFFKSAGWDLKIFNPSDPAYTKIKKIEDLNRGDIIRHVSGGVSYIVDGVYGDSAIAVATKHISNPSEWEVLK